MSHTTVCSAISCYALSNNFVQLEFFGVVLDGHRDGVNAVKFDADLSMLLSGGMSFVCLLSSVAYLLSDNSGRKIVWDLGSHKPLQTIDASFAGSATSLCWVNVLKDGTLVIFKACERWRRLPPSLGLGYISFHCS
jgi:WD40 repeat protein